MHRKAPWGVKKGGGSSPHNRWCQPPIGLCTGIHLKKRCARILGRALRQVRCGKRSEIIGQRRTKTQKNRPYMNDLTASLLRSSSIRRRPTPFLSGCVFLLCFCLKKLLLCVLSHMLCCADNNKLCTCFYSFCLLKTFLFFNEGKSQGNFASSL